MKLNKKRVFIIILALAAIAELAVFFYLWRLGVRPAPANNADKIYSKLVTQEDQKPLPVSSEVINSGRALFVPILMYHHVGALPPKANALRKDLTVPTANFEAEVKWLSQSGYTGISLSDIYLYSQSKFTMPKKPVVFTFDDGYADVFQNAVPILKKYGYTGSFAIITRKVGAAEGDNIYAPWTDIAQAYLGGNEIVSHTQTHFDGSNPKYSTTYINNELSGSINDINQNLGFTTSLLIYPYGHYTDAYIAQAKKAGFVMGVTVHEGKLINLDDLMRVPRVRVHGAETLQRFEKMIIE